MIYQRSGLFSISGAIYVLSAQAIYAPSAQRPNPQIKHAIFIFYQYILLYFIKINYNFKENL